LRLTELPASPDRVLEALAVRRRARRVAALSSGARAGAPMAAGGD
jgi:hypothetical protein